MNELKATGPAPSPRIRALGGHSPAASSDEQPRETLTLSDPPAPEESPAPSARTRLLAGLGVALTAAGVVGPLVVPQPPLTVQCLEDSSVQVETPTLLSQLLAPSELSPQGEGILLCAQAASSAELKAPAYRAAFAWEGLVNQMGGRPDRLEEHAGGGHATVWPYGQAMAASLDQARLTGDYSTFDNLVSGLERYRHAEGGYAPQLQGRGDRYFDDNAWLGLDFIQAHAQRPENPEYLSKARSIFAFLESGIQPQGGLLWKENAERPSFNTCAQGPTIELAVRLYQATGNEHYLQVARSLDGFTDQHLRLANGLYADNIDTGLKQRDEALYSYNQGTPVGAKLLLYRATGDTTYRDQAHQTARAALEHYSQGDRLWQESPAFNAIFFRNLLQVEDPLVRAQLDGYLERAWEEALAPSGLFERPSGMGSYQGPELQMIDQAGLVQLYALSAWPAQDLGLVS